MMAPARMLPSSRYTPTDVDRGVNRDVSGADSSSFAAVDLSSSVAVSGNARAALMNARSVARSYIVSMPVSGMYDLPPCVEAYHLQKASRWSRLAWRAKAPELPRAIWASMPMLVVLYLWKSLGSPRIFWTSSAERSQLGAEQQQLGASAVALHVILSYLSEAGSKCFLAVQVPQTDHCRSTA